MDEARVPEGGVYVFAATPVLVTDPEAMLLLR